MDSVVIVDILFAVGTSIFMISIVPQIIKLRKTEYSDAHSLCHNELQIIAMVLMMLGYYIIHAPISFMITFTQLISRLYFIKLIRNKRTHILTYPSDLLFYSVRFIKRRLGISNE
jgi:hypothetical protein